MHGESCDQVHCYSLEWKGIVFGRDAVQGYFSSVRKVLGLLAGCATFYVFHDPLVHPFPLRVLPGFPDRFISSRVSCRVMVMGQSHDGSFFLFAQVRSDGGAYELLGWQDRNPVVVVFSLVNAGRS